MNMGAVMLNGFDDPYNAYATLLLQYTRCNAECNTVGRPTAAVITHRT